MATCDNLEVIVYTRGNCHLCDDALQVLAKYGLAAATIDIDVDEKLLDQYNDCVPVVMINGKERFRGRVNEILLRRIVTRGASL